MGGFGLWIKSKDKLCTPNSNAKNKQQDQRLSKKDWKEFLMLILDTRG
jgi:hypothetical protein